MKKIKSKKLLVGRRMPKLYHTLPGKKFSVENSEVLNWISNQPDLLDWIFRQLVSAQYIKYLRETGQWVGEDCD